MRRSPRFFLAWFAAIVVALTTARVVGGDLATLHRRAASLGPQVSVIVATRDLALGQTITASDIRRERRYRREIPGVAIRRSSGAVGRVVIVPVLRDSVLFAGHLASAERTGLDAVVPRGERAVHVTPKDGFRPARGSVVDVLAAFDPSVVAVDGPADAAVVVAGGARVLAVDDAPASGDGDPSYAGVTLLVTETEARSIAFAAATADLTLAITPPESACCRDPAS
ncbi:MAG TPA: Flp pilus assembly protein CpaB [Acidimicrobiia bacterium]|nr:Flp pilus assembly protein CpaB [Acidimicrobiia bacterium]